MKKKIIIAVLALFAVGVVAKVSYADKAKKVLVKMQDHEITEADYQKTIKALNIPDSPVVRLRLIDQMVETYLLEKEAKKVDLDQTQEVKEKIEFISSMILKDMYIKDYIQKNSSDSLLKEAYNKKMQEYAPQKEYNAAHILVETEKEIKKVHKAIKAGKKFEILAEKHSQDSTAQNGGDLGFFVKDMMVKPFGDALVSLKVGQISDPVKTDFGWHIIKVKAVRNKPKPSFESMKEKLKASLAPQMIQTHINALKAKAKVDYKEKRPDIKTPHSDNNHVPHPPHGHPHEHP